MPAWMKYTVLTGESLADWDGALAVTHERRAGAAPPRG